MGVDQGCSGVRRDTRSLPRSESVIHEVGTAGQNGTRGGERRKLHTSAIMMNYEKCVRNLDTREEW